MLEFFIFYLRGIVSMRIVSLPILAWPRRHSHQVHAAMRVGGDGRRYRAPPRQCSVGRCGRAEDDEIDIVAFREVEQRRCGIFGFKNMQRESVRRQSQRLDPVLQADDMHQLLSGDGAFRDVSLGARRRMHGRNTNHAELKIE